MTDLFQPSGKPRTIAFEVPGEVRGKGRPRTRVVTTGTGNAFASIYTDAETKKYESRIASHAMTVKVKAGWNDMREVPLRMDIIAYIGIPKSWSKKKRAALADTPAMCLPDADNIYKSCADALNNVLYRDDKMVATISCQKIWIADPEQERLFIKVSEIG